jgi:cupin fold WbuC family metalloprotein
VRFKPLNSEVYVAADPIVRIGGQDIAWLKQRLTESPRGRVRICAHPHPGDPLHEMVIALDHRTYIRPHRHRNKSESFHIIEGAVDVVILDDQGQVAEVVALREPGTGGAFFYRLHAPLYHTLQIRSACLVVHETINGPFAPDETGFAPWSPPESEIAAVESYRAALTRAVAAFLKVPTHEIP